MRTKHTWSCRDLRRNWRQRRRRRRFVEYIYEALLGVYVAYMMALLGVYLYMAYILALLGVYVAIYFLYMALLGVFKEEKAEVCYMYVWLFWVYI